MTSSIDTCELVLPDGQLVRVRPLVWSDRAIYERAVLNLSPRSRYFRFFSPMPRLSERLLDQMTHTDGRHHVAYLALTPDEATAVAAARYIRDSHDPETAELAIAVADDWQRRGVGRQLVGRMVEHARLAGLESLTGMAMRENRAATGLLKGLGFSTVAASGPYSDHLLPLGLQSAARGSPV
jgi:GNAT superfamily N-acetyltransferase